MKKRYYVFQMDVKILNILSLVLLVCLIGLFWSLFPVDEEYLFNVAFPWVFILMIPYFCLHEVFHSIAYVLNGADFSKITYGAHIEKSVLCCLCKQNISRKNILISLLFPFIFLGVITLLIGIIFKSYVLVILSIMNISGCSGDFIMFYALSKLKDYEFSEYDDPIGFGLYTNEDLSKRKMFGLNYIETKDELERNDLKKVTISSVSIIYFLIIMIIGVIFIFLN